MRSACRERVGEGGLVHGTWYSAVDVTSKWWLGREGNTEHRYSTVGQESSISARPTTVTSVYRTTVIFYLGTLPSVYRIINNFGDAVRQYDYTQNIKRCAAYGLKNTEVRQASLLV